MISNYYYFSQHLSQQLIPATPPGEGVAHKNQISQPPPSSMEVSPKSESTSLSEAEDGCL